jgi:hypothetical protein
MTEAVAAKGREWLKIEPDKTYGLGYVDAQFEVDYDFPPDSTWVAIAAEPTVKRTIDHFERLSHWKHYDKIPVKYFMSQLPNKEEIDTFNLAMKLKEAIGAVPFQTTVYKPKIALVARVWFMRPLDLVNMDIESEKAGESSGFTNDLPEEFLAYKKELES